MLGATRIIEFLNLKKNSHKKLARKKVFVKKGVASPRAEIFIEMFGEWKFIETCTLRSRLKRKR